MKIAALIISLLLCACKATSPIYEELPDTPIGSGLVGIDYLKTLANGRSTVIDRDVLIEGFVVANDFRGEFYKQIVIDDGFGGIEIDIDKRNLYQTIPLHTYVAVSCNGLALGRVGGKITLGAQPTGQYATDRIAAADLTRYIKLSDNYEMPDPVEVSVGELSVDLISRYVCIRGLRIVDSERRLTWCDFAEEDEEEEDDEDGEDEDGPYLTYSYRHFVDAHGKELTVKTLNQCHYGSETIPDGEMTLAGIVDYADGQYLLRITNHRIIR